MLRLVLTSLLLTGEALASNCRGAEQSGYCCEGAIFRKDHSNSFSADDLICCPGESPKIDLGTDAPTSCSSGSQIPLTQASQLLAASSSTDLPASGAAAATTAATSPPPFSSPGSATYSGNAAVATQVPVAGLLAVAGGMLFAV